MTVDVQTPVSGAPEVGQLAVVRGRRWVVADVICSELPADVTSDVPPERQHLVSLISVEDDATGEEVTVVWELEPGASSVERPELPSVDPDRIDEPGELDAFLDAVRWGAVTSADSRALQAPFRSGIAIEDYQLEPVVRALRMPRTTLLIADDVGLGKTIEAGLVVQELILRHRARSVMVVCPASLQIQWRDEMREKFGLEFRIVNRPLLAELRRTRGVHANPFTHFPRLIVSIDWLKNDLGMRLLREVLPPSPEIPRRFDMLIVDEVHNVAPAGAGERYASDTLRTGAIRELAPHCEHRLFLSATPHNGYSNSFAALLELLDPFRFARGVEPDPQTVRDVTVRRLKHEMVDEDGRSRFPKREIVPLEVDHPQDERDIHADLRSYATLRARRLKGDETSKLSADFVTTLLKKRLFSSPAAFNRTLEVHEATLRRGPKKRRPAKPSVKVLRARFDEVDQDVADESQAEEVTEEALRLAADAEETPPSPEEFEAIARMREWAGKAARKEDAKTRRLLDWIEETVRPGGDWNDERVIVFTEFRATQRYLHERLAARKLSGDRVSLLDGTTPEDDREAIKARWQADPSLDEVRILLATDAASEGISLQKRCHRLVHAEIPWNPNRLEQRNGRIDRHGQPASEVLIHHFVSSRWREFQNAGRQPEANSLEGDLHFLAVAARKVNQIREDLGSAGPVIERQIEEAMLGHRSLFDDRATDESADRGAGFRRLLGVERKMREEVGRLRARLEESREELHVRPERIEQVVSVALALAGQPALEALGDGRFTMPRLTGSWSPATIGLDHPVTGAIRPITFDHDLARANDDVVLVHLGHRLVQLALGLLRAEVWQAAGSRLARVTMRTADPEVVSAPTAVAHGRLVVTGADGHRLHEEVISAGLPLSEPTAASRLNVGQTEQAAVGARDTPVPASMRGHLAQQVADARPALLAALEARGRERSQSLERTLRDKADQESGAITGVLTELRQVIEAELAPRDDPQQELFNADERRQFDRDVDALKQRLERIPDDIERETAAIRRRYADPTPRLFPATITLLVPEGGTLG
jgi:superfamily II DNA or RNA helicase